MNPNHCLVTLIIIIKIKNKKNVKQSLELEHFSLIICNAASPWKVCPAIGGAGEGTKAFYESHTSFTHSC
jgi:hypothetical protein